MISNDMRLQSQFGDTCKVVQDMEGEENSDLSLGRQYICWEGREHGLKFLDREVKRLFEQCRATTLLCVICCVCSEN